MVNYFEVEIGEAMLTFERSMFKKRRREQLPCDARTAETRLKAKEEVERARMFAWRAILATTKGGEIVTLQSVMDGFCTGPNPSGWITRDAVARHLRALGHKGYLAALKSRDGGAQQYVRISKELDECAEDDV